MVCLRHDQSKGTHGIGRSAGNTAYCLENKMQGLDFFKLILLSAIWGGSFLFMRVAAPEFGPVALIWFRVASGALILTPVLARRRVREELVRHPLKILLVSLFNAAIPWCLLAYAVLTLEAGFTSLLNAATPIFTALIGFFWLKLPLTRLQTLGLAVGMAGVTILAWGKLSFEPGGAGPAIVATLAATMSYGYISHFIKRHLHGLSPWTIAFGNLSSATVVLTPFLILHHPAQLPGGAALWCATALGVFSTAVAFILLFDILSRSGATAVTTVTFIIPVFGVLFGALFLGEDVTVRMITGMVVALTGAALTTKLIG